MLTVRGDPEHPVSKGYTCPKGRALPALHHHADRLDRPRVDGTERGWDATLDDLAERLGSVITAHGPDAVGALSRHGPRVRHCRMDRRERLARCHRVAASLHSRDGRQRPGLALRRARRRASASEPDLGRRTRAARAHRRIESRGLARLRHRDAGSDHASPQRAPTRRERLGARSAADRDRGDRRSSSRDSPGQRRERARVARARAPRRRAFASSDHGDRRRGSGRR